MYSKSHWRNCIEKVIFNTDFPVNLTSERISLERMREGKSSLVYKVELPKNKLNLLVKVYESNQMEKKEMDVYDTYLRHFKSQTPKLVHYSREDNMLFLEWLEGYVSKPHFNEDFYSLTVDWLIEKYNFSLNIFENQSIDIDRQVSWMIERPLHVITQIDGIQNYVSISTLNSFVQKTSKLMYLLNRQLPMILEHGDLEKQNLLVNSNNDIRFVDWGACYKSFGFGDIAQIMLNMASDNLDSFDTVIRPLRDKYNIKDFNFYVRTFATLKLLNFVAYQFQKKKSIDIVKLTYINKLLN